MKHVLFGIFAHPDDEAFGPSATLLKEVASGTELHLVCLTDGQAGVNTLGCDDLGAVRLHEWRQACALIGATGVYPLHYQDGGLCHGMYETLGKQVAALIDAVCAAAEEPVHLRFMTMDQNGITGHLDHIAASYLATKLFYCYKHQPPPNTVVGEIAYYCLSEAQAPADGEWTTFYTPVGRPDAYLNRRVDVRDLLPQKFAIMRIHASQSNDAEQIIGMGEDALASDNFHVVKA